MQFVRVVQPRHILVRIVGSSVGSAVGVVGVTVGSAVGVVGATVGATVGAPVGAVGAVLGATVPLQHGKKWPAIIQVHSSMNPHSAVTVQFVRVVQPRHILMRIVGSSVGSAVGVVGVTVGSAVGVLVEATSEE